MSDSDSAPVSDAERVLREALKFYADKKNYQRGRPGMDTFEDGVHGRETDQGAIARAALRAPQPPSGDVRECADCRMAMAVHGSVSWCMNEECARQFEVVVFASLDLPTQPCVDVELRAEITYATELLDAGINRDSQQDLARRLRAALRAPQQPPRDGAAVCDECKWHGPMEHLRREPGGVTHCPECDSIAIKEFYKMTQEEAEAAWGQMDKSAPQPPPSGDVRECAKALSEALMLDPEGYATCEYILSRHMPSQPEKNDG